MFMEISPIDGLVDRICLRCARWTLSWRYTPFLTGWGVKSRECLTPD